MDTENTSNKTVHDSGPSIKRTSINIPEQLWDEVKIAAIRRKLSATGAVEQALRKWVSEPFINEDAA